MGKIISFYLSQPPSKEALQQIKIIFAKAGCEPKQVNVRPAYKNENVEFRKRRKHYCVSYGGKPLCGIVTVSAKNITTNKHAVTCLNCKRMIGNLVI